MGKKHSSDVFYLIKIPAYTGILSGAPRLTIDAFGRVKHEKGEAVPIHHPEKKLWFNTKRGAKRYCLEHNISIDSIIKVEVYD